uniref:Dolichyl-phosphate beta-glucosyltransferase n=1 Tax=Ciona savignyi TaxID=51511 RepID=H2Z1V6_CIOSA
LLVRGFTFVSHYSINMANYQRFESENFFKRTDGSKDRFPSIMDEESVDLSIIVPSYNEEERLPVMMNETIDYLEEKCKKSSSYKYEIIVVDDGSTDATTDVALGFSKTYGDSKIRVLTLEKNRGKGGAVRLGMLSARGKYLLMADADGATKFADIQKVENKLEEIDSKPHGRALVVGSRAHLEKDSIASRSIFRTFLMKGFHLIVWLLCVRSVKDSQCGFKIFTRNAARILFTNLHVEKWAFDVELLYIAEDLNIPIAEAAVRWTEIDGSKIVPVFSWIQMGKDIILIWVHYYFGLWTIKRNLD